MVAGGCRGVLPIECEQVAAMLLGLSLLQKRPTSSCTLVRNILLRRNHIPIALRASSLIATVLDRLHLKYGDTTITRTSTAWQRIQQQFMTTPRTTTPLQRKQAPITVPTTKRRSRLTDGPCNTLGRSHLANQRSVVHCSHPQTAEGTLERLPEPRAGSCPRMTRLVGTKSIVVNVCNIPSRASSTSS